VIAETSKKIRVVEHKSREFRVCYLLIASILLWGLSSSLSSAQHETHGMSGSGHVMTMPDNDEILNSAPESITLLFESDVVLLKLALREPGQGKEPIDIGFRYRPGAGVRFIQPLPILPIADYYTVEWAAFDANAGLIKGTFYFSFGDNAHPPSAYRNQMEHRMEVLSPDYRLQ